MSVNSDLRNAVLRHQLGLHRLTNATLRRILGQLNRAEVDLLDQIHKRLARVVARGFDTGKVTTRMLEELLVEVRTVNREVHRGLERELRRDLLALGGYEAEFQAQMFRTVPPVAVALRTLAPERLEAIVTRRPFQGRLLKEWAKSIEAERLAKVREAVRLGMLEGEGVSAITRRIRGTRALGYRDGILAITRHHAETIVRTATAHVAESVRDDLYAENADVLRGVVWTSVLDGRTTPQCLVRDGKLFTAKTHAPIGHSIPWGAGPGRLHMACRSTSVPAIKSYRDLGVDLDDAPTGSRASWQGQVPADTTFLQWIEGQGRDFAGQVFGPTRLRLLREGKLKPRDLFGSKGEYWTLEELRRRESEAFALAGFRVAA